MIVQQQAWPEWFERHMGSRWKNYHIIFPWESLKTGWVLKEEVTERRGRSKKLPDHFKETRGYWKLKDEAVARTLRGIRCGIGYGPVLINYGMNTLGGGQWLSLRSARCYVGVCRGSPPSLHRRLGGSRNRFNPVEGRGKSYLCRESNSDCRYMPGHNPIFWTLSRS